MGRISRKNPLHIYISYGRTEYLCYAIFVSMDTRAPQSPFISISKFFSYLAMFYVLYYTLPGECFMSCVFCSVFFILCSGMSDWQWGKISCLALSAKWKCVNVLLLLWKTLFSLFFFFFFVIDFAWLAE